MSRLKKRGHDACHFDTHFRTRFSRPVLCYYSALNIRLFPLLFSGRLVYLCFFLCLCRVHLSVLGLLVPFHLYLALGITSFILIRMIKMITQL